MEPGLSFISTKTGNTKTSASVRDIPLTRTVLKYLTSGEPGQFVCGGDYPWAYTQVKHMRDRIATVIATPPNPGGLGLE